LLFFSDLLYVHHRSVRPVIGYDHLRHAFELTRRVGSSKSDVGLGMYLECTALSMYRSCRPIQNTNYIIVSVRLAI